MDEKQTILITGATDGLGFALGQQLQATGHHVLLHGRRPLENLDPALFSRQNYIQADFLQSDAVEKVCRFLEFGQIEKVDLVIHNAGAGYYGSIKDQSPVGIDSLLAVNLRAPIDLTYALLPRVRRASGKFVFISSVVSGLPGTDYAVYTATKSALEGFARSLRVELGSHDNDYGLNPVGVQIIRPGAARTGMHAKMNIPQSSLQWEKFPPADQIAQAIINAMNGSRAAVTIGVKNKLLHFAGRSAAALIDDRLRANNKQPISDSAGYFQKKRWCMITGAADGIGRAFAIRFAQAGYGIVGIDRDAKRAAHLVAELSALGVEAVFIVADLTTDAGLAKVIAEIPVRAPYDLIIHNAGVNYVGRFEDTNLLRQQSVLDVNLRAPMQLTAAFLRENMLTPIGSFLFVASLSKYVGYPGAAVYAASKDGLSAYARSLRVALGRQNNVLTIFPGPTRTPHARRYSSDNRRENSRMAPDVLADAAYRAVQKRRATLIPGFTNRLLAAAGMIWPGGMDRAMQKAILDKLDGNIYV